MALDVPARDAMVILGHSRISVTLEIYTDSDEAAHRAAPRPAEQAAGALMTPPDNAVAWTDTARDARTVTEVRRFRDDGSGFHSWALEPVLVKCPRCANRAEARVVDRTDIYALKRRLTCTSCGLIVDRLSDGYGSATWSGFDLWLSAPFRGEVFWAHNGSHMAYLRAYIGATLRERFPEGHLEGDHWESQTMIQRLPTWMKLAANRRPLLALIDDLERTLK